MSEISPRTQLLSLLWAAKEQPHDEAVRLVLADRLEDDGEPSRAEFVRLQCGLAAGSSVPLPPDRRPQALQRVADLLARYGGGWLGPLWEHGGTWHRGLLSVELDRLRMPDNLDEIFPWVDTLELEVPGREALRWAAALCTLASPNHVTLHLRRPFPIDTLLDLLAESPATPCLRTLTLRWPPGTGLRTDRGVYINLPDDFFARVMTLPLCRHLTHLGSSFLLDERKSRLLRAGGVEPVLPRAIHWPHALPLVTFLR